MTKIVLLLLLAMLCNFSFSQNSASVAGKVTDKQTNEALPGATVSVKGTLISEVSNNEGNFNIKKKLNVGKFVLIFSYIGYETLEMAVTVSDEETTTVNIGLSRDERIGNAVVVSASKQPEKITNAPASIQVIGTKELAQFAGSNVTELMSKLQGIQYTRSGVDEITFNARGFNNAFNNRMFLLVDGRNSITPLSGGLPIFNNGSINKDDIERMEAILGPQNALYGPNAHSALFNYITKDPRKYQGTMISASAGSQQQFSYRFRHALKINNRWAYKLTGEYLTGKDYKWYDTVYAGSPPAFFGPPVQIPERIHDFTFSRQRGEAHVYYSITPKADIILSSGGGKFTRIQVTTAGRNQLRDLTYSFLQARFVHPHFFATLYNSWGNIGRSISIYNYTRDFWNSTHDSRGPLSPDAAEVYATRLGNTFKERSLRLNAEVQYNTKFEKTRFEKAGLSLVTGLTYQKEKPNSYGIALVDNFQKIKITQYGAVVQLEKEFRPWSLRFISTTRFDHHSNFGNFFAPRFALVKAIANGNIRITWGKAYSMPSILHQYAGINRFLFGNGAGIKYIPTDTKFSDPKSITYTIPLKAEQVNTWEAGYKGSVVKKLFIDITTYYGTSKNFISPTITVFGRVLAVGDIPVTHSQPFAGSVDINDTLRTASFLTYFNYAAVKTYGIDLAINYTFNKHISADVKYSWFGSDITGDNLKNDANKDNYVSLEERSLNSPKHRGMVILNFQNLCKEKLFASISARWVPQYDFYSGTQIGTEAGKGSRGRVYGGINPLNGQPRYYLKNFDWGPLGDFTTVDLNAGYKFNEMVSFNMGITNLLNTRQIEFVGSRSIGRLIMFELKVNVPNSKQRVK